MSKSYEYKVFEPGTSLTISGLRNMGEEGWVFCGLFPMIVPIPARLKLTNPNIPPDATSMPIETPIFIREKEEDPTDGNGHVPS